MLGIGGEEIGGVRVTRGGQPNSCVGWIPVGISSTGTERGLKKLKARDPRALRGYGYVLEDQSQNT
jgi:hypothetical protein